MLKRKALTLFAVIFAMMTIVGAGFSAWVFSRERRGDVGLGINIDYATTFGEITGETGAFRLKLDQGGVDNQKDGAVGISVEKQASTTTWSTVNAITATWKISEHSYDDTKDNLTFSVNIYIHTNSLGKYVEIPEGFQKNSAVIGAEGSEHHHTGYTIYTKLLSGAEVVPGTATNNYYNVQMTLNISNGMFAYKTEDGTTKKPQTFQEYQAMVAAITSIAESDKVLAENVKAGDIFNVAASVKPIIIEFVVTNTGASAA